MNKKIQQQINDLERRVTLLEKINKTKSSSLVGQGKGKKLTVREFLISKKPSDDVKKTLAIGYYLEKYDNFPSFNADDLHQGYEKAKEKKPLNINDKVNLNIKKGHMDGASEKKDNKKAWYVTNSGEQFVKNNFEK